MLGEPKTPVQGKSNPGTGKDADPRRGGCRPPQGDEMRRKILEHVTSKGNLYRSEQDEWMRYDDEE